MMISLFFAPLDCYSGVGLQVQRFNRGMWDRLLLFRRRLSLPLSGFDVADDSLAACLDMNMFDRDLLLTLSPVFV
jgi:hypothetical protein